MNQSIKLLLLSLHQNYIWPSKHIRKCTLGSAERLQEWMIMF